MEGLEHERTLARRMVVLNALLTLFIEETRKSKLKVNVLGYVSNCDQVITRQAKVTPTFQLHSKFIIFTYNYQLPVDWYTCTQSSIGYGTRTVSYTMLQVRWECER